jgi:drug/metabolite transporter (DMT)-like permease
MAGRRDSRAWRGYALVVLAAASWAVGGVIAKWLFSPLDDATSAWPVPPVGVGIDPATLSGTRALLAAVILALYLAVANRKAFRVSRRYLPFLGLFGIAALAMVHFAYFQAISHTNVATAILLEYLAPVIVLIIAVVFLGEPFTWSLPVGVALSVLGLALVVGAVGADTLAVSQQGIAWGLAAAGFFAAYSLMGDWASGRIGSWTLLVYGLIFAALFWLLYLGPERVFAALREPTTLVAVTVIAVVSTIIPFGAFLAALRYIDPTRALVTSTLEPVIAGAAAFMLLGESFAATQLLGAALVIVAIVVVQRPAGVRESVPPAQ